MEKHHRHEPSTRMPFFTHTSAPTNTFARFSTPSEPHSTVFPFHFHFSKKYFHFLRCCCLCWLRARRKNRKTWTFSKKNTLKFWCETTFKANGGRKTFAFQDTRSLNEENVFFSPHRKLIFLDVKWKKEEKGFHFHEIECEVAGVGVSVQQDQKIGNSRAFAYILQFTVFWENLIFNTTTILRGRKIKILEIKKCT